MCQSVYGIKGKAELIEDNPKAEQARRVRLTVACPYCSQVVSALHSSQGEGRAILFSHKNSSEEDGPVCAGASMTIALEQQRRIGGVRAGEFENPYEDPSINFIGNG